MTRTFAAHSVPGTKLQFRSITGYEQMRHLFKFRVRLLSQTRGISAKTMLGTVLTAEVDLTTEAGGTGIRYLCDQVAIFACTWRNGDYCADDVLMRSWLWLATRYPDFKIFQNMTVPGIVQDILVSYGFIIGNTMIVASPAILIN